MYMITEPAQLSKILALPYWDTVFTGPVSLTKPAGQQQGTYYICVLVPIPDRKKDSSSIFYHNTT